MSLLTSDLDKVLEIHRKVVLEGHVGSGTLKNKTYSVSNLRGGVGKTSICFNLAYEISRRKSLLIADVCPQANLTEVIMRSERPSVTIYNALQPRVLGPAFGDEAVDIALRTSQYVPSFAGGEGLRFHIGRPRALRISLLFVSAAWCRKHPEQHGYCKDSSVVLEKHPAIRSQGH